MTIPNVGGILSALWVVLLCLAVVALARSSRGRALLVAVGGSLALTLVASFVRSWPFGFARTNLWVEPLLVLMAGIGAVETARWLAVIPWGGRHGRWPFARSSRIARAPMAAVVTVGTTALALALLYDGVVYAQLHGNQSHHQYGVEERTAVATVNREAAPGRCTGGDRGHGDGGVALLPGRVRRDVHSDGCRSAVGPDHLPGPSRLPPHNRPPRAGTSWPAVPLPALRLVRR